MSARKQSGFTLVELIVVISIMAIVSTVFVNVFRSTLFSYLKLQQESSTLSLLSFQSDRVTNVLRSTTSIESANDADVTIYAYFYPSDAYVSRVKYYIQTVGSVKSLVADLTPMSANPPIGVPDTSKTKTLSILSGLSVPSNGKIFTYLNAGNSAITTPISDTSIIKSIKLSLGITTVTGSIQNQDVQVVIRNRKSNL